MFPENQGKGIYDRDRRLREIISEERLRTWYRRYYQRGLSLQKIGRLVEVNPRYLSQLFKKAGLPVTPHVHERLLPEEGAEGKGSAGAT